MSDTASARVIQLELDESPTTRRPALRVIENRGWDDVPDGPVPPEVIRYFEAALEREEERRFVRGTRDTLV